MESPAGKELLRCNHSSTQAAALDDAAKSVAKPFRLLKQALKWIQPQDLVTKNVCGLCKPPNRRGNVEHRGSSRNAQNTDTR